MKSDKGGDIYGCLYPEAIGCTHHLRLHYTFVLNLNFGFISHSLGDDERGNDRGAEALAPLQRHGHVGRGGEEEDPGKLYLIPNGTISKSRKLSTSHDTRKKFLLRGHLV